MRKGPRSEFGVDGVRLADTRAWCRHIGSGVGMIVEEEVIPSQDVVEALSHWWPCFLTRQISVPGIPCNQGAGGQGEDFSDPAVWVVVSIEEEEDVI